MKTDPVCAYCSKPGKLQRDHVVPRARGGPDTAANIVMACQPCNLAKSDQLASEWLGDRCPPAVLLIEARVNAKLKSVYKRREATAPPKLYAFSVCPDGELEYVGLVVSETATTIRLEAASILALWGGIWDLSGELYDLPRSQCRVFNDRDSCIRAADMVVERTSKFAR